VADVLERLKAALADRYTIARELGSGGMATVYLAEDVKHHRKVAVKVLRPELAAALGPERFLREIEITANLNHPHILPLLDSGEADGFLFYVMPYVEGESLRDRLSREKQLPIDDSLKIASEVADALNFAHEHNVIHRDIKPENILLEAKHAVVADFGVARAIEEAGETRLTETGIAIGTPAYLSPEQASGERELDGRSDIYSLGCVLYEMLAGEPPFTGPTAESIVHQHLTTESPSVTARRTAAPLELADVLKKALAKTPADRFATAEQFADALTATPTVRRPVEMPPATVAAAVREKLRRNLIAYAAVAILAIIGAYTVISRTVGPPEPVTAAEPPKLAVLPFANLGSSADDYFADGITEEITSRIAQISGLHVISRTSAIQYKNHEKTLRQIGEELSVDYVVEGTIRTDRAPDRSGQVRVTPQLIRVSDDAHLWTEGYTADLVPGEIFRVQADIAEQVAQALDVTLLGTERQRLAAMPTDDLEAYQYYLLGNAHDLRHAVGEDARLAVQMYERAVELDSDFGLAYAALSRARIWLHWVYDEYEQLAEGKDAVDRALQLDADLPEAHSAMGDYLYYGRRDYEKALEEYAIVRRQRPNDADVIESIGYIRRRQGEWEEAAAKLKAAADLDPRHQNIVKSLGETYLMMRRYRDAERYLNIAVSLAPDLPEAHQHKALLYLLWQGSKEKALGVLHQAPEGTVEYDLAWSVTPRILGRVFAAEYHNGLRLPPRTDAEGVLFFQAAVASQTGRPDVGRAHYERAYSVLEARTAATGDTAHVAHPPRGRLGIAAAGTGRMEEAIQLGQQAVDMLPVSKDALQGPDEVATRR
jgi:serine/threonine-protein kinase